MFLDSFQTINKSSTQLICSSRFTSSLISHSICVPRFDGPNFPVDEETNSVRKIKTWSRMLHFKSLAEGDLFLDVCNRVKYRMVQLIKAYKTRYDWFGILFLARFKSQCFKLHTRESFHDLEAGNSCPLKKGTLNSEVLSLEIQTSYRVVVTSAKWKGDTPSRGGATLGQWGEAAKKVDSGWGRPRENTL